MLENTFAALADPTRRAILGLLAESELSVGELVDQFSITQSAVSRHLNVLEHANLVERRRDGQRRICALRAGPLEEVDEWMERYRTY
ncbi:MAG: ArsR/SmtB family transcription factor, partial [Aestuariivirgaceae bacterium]